MPDTAGAVVRPSMRLGEKGAWAEALNYLVRGLGSFPRSAQNAPLVLAHELDETFFTSVDKRIAIAGCDLIGAIVSEVFPHELPGTLGRENSFASIRINEGNLVFVDLRDFHDLLLFAVRAYREPCHDISNRNAMFMQAID